MLINEDVQVKWLFLTIGASGYLLSGPVFQIGITGWVIPIGILYFVRSSRTWRGYLWSVLFMSTFIFISSHASSPLPIVATLVSSILSGFLDGIPFLFDRILYRKLKPGHAVFLFPVLAVTYEYLISFPLSSIGVVGATQSRFEELAQLASITGVFGISFVMYWFASSIVSRTMDREGRIGNLKACAVVLGLVLIFGIVKIRTNDLYEKTVKVSGIVLEEHRLYEELYEIFFDIPVEFTIGAGGSPELDRLFGALEEFRKNPQDERYQGVFEALKNFEDDMMETTITEAKSGSKIIVWSETNLAVFKDDEEVVLERVQKIALEEEVTILASMAVLLPYTKGGPMYENKSVLVTQDGEIVDRYEKAKPVPFLDSSLPGDGRLAIIGTQHGKLTSAICYDADFPDLMRQSGKADILLLPSNDWLGISPYHGDNAIFRAIENGVSIVRPTGTGQSIVFGPNGRVLARLDAYDHEVRVINAHVPIEGVTTVFDYVGNTFAWLCIAATMLLVGIAMTRRRISGNDL